MFDNVSESNNRMKGNSFYMVKHTLHPNNYTSEILS